MITLKLSMFYLSAGPPKTILNGISDVSDNGDSDVIPSQREPEPVLCPSFNIKSFCHIYGDAPLSNFYFGDGYSSPREDRAGEALRGEPLRRVTPPFEPAPGLSAHRCHSRRAQMCAYRNTDVPMLGLERAKMKRATQSHWLTQAYVSENALITPSGCFQASVQQRWDHRSPLASLLCRLFSVAIPRFTGKRTEESSTFRIYLTRFCVPTLWWG